MSNAELLRIALRYTLAFGRGHLSVFMAGVSVAGLVLGTALLLTVLSVMNGFEREMRDRILALVPHVTVHTPADGGEPYDLAASLRAVPGVLEVAPFVNFDAMVVRGSRVTAVAGLGLDSMPAGAELGVSLATLQTGDVVLGDAVAERLATSEGDYVTFIASQDSGFRAAAITSERLRVAAVVDTGTELDEALALMTLEDASVLAGLKGGISGLRVRLDDPFAVDARLPLLRRAISPGSYATTWRLTHGNLYAAIRLSRDLVVLLLTSIIGVAAFNVVSALVLIVIDQRGSIAILRTLGASPGAMARLFLIQGLLIGVAGSLIGCAIGTVLSLSLPSLVSWLEGVFQLRFLNTDVYPVSFIPVDLRGGDLLLIACTAVLMCMLASLYPALRAARLAPARVLHQDM